MRWRDHALSAPGAGLDDVTVEQQATHWRNTPSADGEDGETGRDEVSPAEAEELYAEEAHTILRDVAATYHRVIEYGDLAARVQQASGVQTRRMFHSWIGRVLAIVAERSHEAGEPALTSLVVHKSDGTVGPGFDVVAKLRDEEPLEDPQARETAAAAARLECYRWAGADLPEGGGRPAMSPRLAQIRTRERRVARQEAQPDICPHCFMAIPATGTCDNCG